MKSNLTFVVVGMMLVLTGVWGCGKFTQQTTGPTPPVSIETVAKTLTTGPVDEKTQQSYLLLSDDQRVELRRTLRQLMSEDQIKSRTDIFAIVGPSSGDTVSITALNAADRDRLQRIAGPNAAQEYIAVGGIPQYSQRDPTWSWKKLGFSSSSTIGQYGCYLTCISMLTGLWGWPGETPYYLNDWTVNGRAHYPFQWQSDLIRTTEAIQYPYICRPWSYISSGNYEGVRRQLRAGHPVVVHTTWGGNHFMIVYCWDGSQFWVVDPWPTSGQLHPLTSSYGSILEFRLLGYFPV